LARARRGYRPGLGRSHHKLKYRLIEQEDSLGGWCTHYPRNKITMTAPASMPIVGQSENGEIKKEDLPRFLAGRGEEDRAQGQIPRTHANPSSVPAPEFIVKTSLRSYSRKRCC